MTVYEQDLFTGPFQMMLEGKKTFAFHKESDGMVVEGDEIIYHEWNRFQRNYTGRRLRVRVLGVSHSDALVSSGLPSKIDGSPYMILSVKYVFPMGVEKVELVKTVLPVGFGLGSIGSIVAWWIGADQQWILFPPWLALTFLLICPVLYWVGEKMRKTMWRDHLKPNKK